MGVEALHPDVGAIDDRLAARIEHFARRGDRGRPETRLDATLERIVVPGSAQQVIEGHGYSVRAMRKPMPLSKWSDPADVLAAERTDLAEPYQAPPRTIRVSLAPVQPPVHARPSAC